MSPAARRTRPGKVAPATGGEGPRATMRILETRVFRGPNYWSYEPAIKLVVDLGILEAYPTNLIPGFTDGLLANLPGIAQHSCSTGRSGGFVRRLKDGTWLGHVAEHVALQLQRDAGTEVGRGKTRSTGEEGRYHVVYSYAEESVGKAAGERGGPGGGAGARVRPPGPQNAPRRNPGPGRDAPFCRRRCGPRRLSGRPR